MRVLLIDDHAVFRQGMVSVLEGVDPEVQATHAASLRHALEQLRGAPPFDLITYDLKLQGSPSESGVGGLESLLERCGTAPIIVLSGEEQPELVRRCMKSGARGFIPKSSDARVMVRAIQLVLCGEHYLPSLALTVQRPDGRLEGLTPRQRDVLRQLALGKANKVIARELGITDATVKSHVTAIMSHLGAASRAEVVFVMNHNLATSSC